jgi:signal transduction histidine kinase
VAVAFSVAFSVAFAIVLATFLAVTSLGAFDAGAAHAADAAPAGYLDLGEAEFCASDAPTVPGAGCPWQHVTLAHLWRGPHGAFASNAWYRLRWPVARDATGEMALYLRAMNRVARVFVDGRLVATFGDFGEPMPMNWNRAQLAVVPPSMLPAGLHEIEIQERAYGWEHGWLAPVLAGEASVLRPMYRWRVFWQNDLVMILGATTALMSVFILGVWLARRDQTMYFWLGCATLTWSAISLDYFATYSPLPGYAWEQFIEVAQVGRSVMIYVFVLRYIGQRRPVLERAMWAWWAAGSFVDVFLPHLVHWVEWWYLGTLLAAIWFWVLLVDEARRRRRSEAVLLALAAVTTITLSGYDLWLFSQHSWTDRVYLAHFGAPLFIFVLGWILTRRFIESLDAHERLAAVLEQRVQDKARELQHNYEELLEARRSEALAVERARIMSEMHDGIGSQLTLALSLVDREEGAPAQRVAGVLRESVDDLQLIIDSLEPVENDLLTVLGIFRYRVQPRLERAGLALRWDVEDLPPLPLLTPQNVLSVLRIVQEAFANCLKHARATQLALSTALERDGNGREVACIRICDDGRGLDGGRPGRGLENMRRRAAAMGGRVDIVSAPGRTEVVLRLPTGAAVPG